MEAVSSDLLPKEYISWNLDSKSFHIPKHYEAHYSYKGNKSKQVEILKNGSSMHENNERTYRTDYSAYQLVSKLEH